MAYVVIQDIVGFNLIDYLIKSEGEIYGLEYKVKI